MKWWIIRLLGVVSITATLIGYTSPHTEARQEKLAAQISGGNEGGKSVSAEVESPGKTIDVEHDTDKAEGKSEATGSDEVDSSPLKPEVAPEKEKSRGVAEDIEPLPPNTIGEVAATPEQENTTETTGNEAKSAEKQAEEPPVEMEPEKKEPMEVEASNVRLLTKIEPGHNDSYPVWSPSGELIAFERSIGDKQEIIVSRVDGSVVHRIYHQSSSKDEAVEMFLPGVAEDASYNAGLSWSTDGNGLVFMSNGGSGNYDLYLLPEVGKTTTIRLTDHSEKDSHPHWSPVASELVFVSGRTGKADIYLMKLDTRQMIKLTNGEKSYLYPQWSPDGKQIVMIYGTNENHDIYLIEDLTKPMETPLPLTIWTYDDLRPIWSPDGKKIAFYTNYNEEGNPKLWSLAVIAADGTEPSMGEGLAAKVVAKDIIPDVEKGPAWMPDSKRIIYVKNDRQAYNPIYIVDIENKSNLLLKTGAKMNHDVTCSVNGTIAFRAQVEQWDHIHIAELKE